MPNPIKPMHELEEHNELFGRKEDYGASLSDMQLMFLDGDKPTRQAAKQTFADNTIKMLEDIYKNEDMIVNAATESLSTNSKVLYRVPTSISDNELLGLKTQGLVLGSGRSVSLSETGKIALRDKWLKSENHLKENRTKDKFEFRQASVENEKSVKTSKFKKIKG
jgi:hypothetical protein